MSQRRDARGSQSSSGTSHSASTALAQNLDAMTVVPNDETQIRAQTRSNPKARAVVQAHSNEELHARKLFSFRNTSKGNGVWIERLSTPCCHDPHIMINITDGN